MEAPRKPFSGDPKDVSDLPNAEDTPQLNDEEIISLFKDYKVGNYYVGVVPRRIEKKTTSGLEKPPAALEKEQEAMMREGVLAVAIGKEVEDPVEIGDRLHMSQYAQVHQVIGSEEGYVMNVFERGYICVIKSQKGD